MTGQAECEYSRIPVKESRKISCSPFLFIRKDLAILTCEGMRFPSKTKTLRWDRTAAEWDYVVHGTSPGEFFAVDRIKWIV